MAISIRNVEDALSEIGLLKPRLEALNPNEQSYRSLLLQPAGPILVDNSRIGPLNLEFANLQATRLLEIAKEKGHHLVITPEYYLPIQTLFNCVTGDTFPTAGALWALGCESMTPSQVNDFKEKCSGHCKVIFEADNAAEVQGIYYDPLAYCFTTTDKEGNDVRVVILQFKTISSRDGQYFENKNLRCGNLIYQFKGESDLLSLASIICSDAFNISQNEPIRSSLARFAILIHIQLNQKPKHADYLRYRVDTFSKNKALNNCDIICLNWAENIIQHEVLESEGVKWKNESGSAWYIAEDRCSSRDIEVEKNEALGLYYSKHVKKRDVLHFHFGAAIFELTVAKIAQTGLYVHDNNLGPKLDARYTWDDAQQDWISNGECPDPGLKQLCELNDNVKAAFAAQIGTSSRLQIERAIALSCGLTVSNLDWYKAGNLDACKLHEDEVIRRSTLCLDRDDSARQTRESRMKLVAALNVILNNEPLPLQINDLNGGGSQIIWKPDNPHINIYKNGTRPALVAYLGMDPSEDTIANVSDAAYELLRLENNENHKFRIAVCYRNIHGQSQFAKISKLSDITHGGGSAVDITEGQ